MKTTCQHCQRQCRYHEIANAHTVFEKKEGEITFSSTDDNILGIDVCQVCYKPPFWARLWHTVFKNHGPRVSNLRIETLSKMTVIKS